LVWNDVRINIVDTPGHADFGGEVERILSMVDGVVLLVDAAEGPMPQTKFVLTKALNLGLKPIVLVNKIDRSDARHEEVLNEVFDLFCNLGASDEQLDFPVMYASGRNGWAVKDLENEERSNLHGLFDLILEHVGEPMGDIEQPFSMLVTTREYDKFLGRILTGRIQNGVLKPNLSVRALSTDGSVVEMGRVSKILSFRGLERVPVEEAHAGDIVAISGLERANVADTIASPEVTEAIKAQPIDPPTLSMLFSVNDSPLAGKEGKLVTSRLIKDRLEKEAEGNVAIRVTTTADGDAFEVAGRGELQLGVLIETMRREGFELSISRPKVLFKQDESTGEKMEPYEEVRIDVDTEFSGSVMQAMILRKAKPVDMLEHSGKTRIIFEAPSRGLIGYHGQFLNETRGTGVMNRVFKCYGPHCGELEGRRSGVLISTDTGDSVAFALWNLEERGKMFIGAGVPVYQGMIIGENSKDQDLEVNPLKGKKLTNVRASGKDDAIRLTTPIAMSLEQAITYIEDDELVEVTPKSIRLRKRHLDPNERKRAERSAKD